MYNLCEHQIQNNDKLFNGNDEVNEILNTMALFFMFVIIWQGKWFVFYFHIIKQKSLTFDDFNKMSGAVFIDFRLFSCLINKTPILLRYHTKAKPNQNLFIRLGVTMAGNDTCQKIRHVFKKKFIVVENNSWTVWQNIKIHLWLEAKTHFGSLSHRSK